MRSSSASSLAWLSLLQLHELTFSSLKQLDWDDFCSEAAGQETGWKGSDVLELVAPLLCLLYPANLKVIFSNRCLTSHPCLEAPLAFSHFSSFIANLTTVPFLLNLPSFWESETTGCHICAVCKINSDLKIADENLNTFPQTSSEVTLKTGQPVEASTSCPYSLYFLVLY